MKMNNKGKLKRIVALIGAIILVLIYVATLVVAVVNFEGADKVLNGLIACDIVIPLILWGYLTIYRIASKKDESLVNACQDAANSKESEES